jgi:hypothetical protein
MGWFASYRRSRMRMWSDPSESKRANALKCASITLMPEDSKAVPYLCECGKKWAIPKADLERDQTWECKCGRTIVVRGGAVFSTRRK